MFRNGNKSEFAITRYRDSNTNLRTRLLKIINRAGVKPWPKLFHNLRASCETDLAKIHPIKAVCDWIGNSITVAQRHYLQTTEEDFERASGLENPTQQPSVQARKDSQTKIPGKENHWKTSVSPSRVVGDEGLETEDATRLNGNGLCQLNIATDAESDAILSEREPGYDRFTESLMMIAGLPLSNADKAEAIKRLLKGAGR